MRQASAALWRDFLAAYQRIHVYTVDPGAHAMAGELVPLIHDLGRLGTWFAEGWSAVHAPRCRAASDLPNGVIPGYAVVLGSQTDFSRTQAVLRMLAPLASTLFMFDHWKNYAEHFGSGPLPTAIVVPDETGRRLLISAVSGAVAERVRVLPHLAIEAAADRIAALELTSRPGTVALLLDPTEPADGLGYDWRSTLAAAARHAAGRPIGRILVKPHPRQDEGAVERELDIWRKSGVPYERYRGDLEPLIAIAEEVWGMTTVALNIALAAGKPIRSFQLGRNNAGERASNPHIEPFTIV